MSTVRQAWFLIVGSIFVWLGWHFRYIRADSGETGIVTAICWLVAFCCFVPVFANFWEWP